MRKTIVTAAAAALALGTLAFPGIAFAADGAPEPCVTKDAWTETVEHPAVGEPTLTVPNPDYVAPTEGYFTTEPNPDYVAPRTETIKHGAVTCPTDPGPQPEPRTGWEFQDTRPVCNTAHDGWATFDVQRRYWIEYAWLTDGAWTYGPRQYTKWETVSSHVVELKECGEVESPIVDPTDPEPPTKPEPKPEGKPTPKPVLTTPIPQVRAVVNAEPKPQAVPAAELAVTGGETLAGAAIGGVAGVAVVTGLALLVGKRRAR